MEDWGVGLILLFFSLFLLCGCLICMVKVLNSMMKGNFIASKLTVMEYQFILSYI